MAIYHCNISNVSRAKGSSSCATLSYISGKAVKDERLDKTFNYGRAQRVIATGTFIPNAAPQEYLDPRVLFNSIEKFETAANARTAKKIEVALPKEFDIHQQVQVVEQYIKNNITARGYACSYAIHMDANGNNPHAHILIANRQLDNKGEWSIKGKKEYALDDNGNRIPVIDPETGQQKLDSRNRKQWKRINVVSNPLDKKETLQALRQQWAVECNKLLPRFKHIDHRSYADRGMERIPTVHEGYAARQMERRGAISERCDYNRSAYMANMRGRAHTASLKRKIENIIAQSRAERPPQVVWIDINGWAKAAVFGNKGLYEYWCGLRHRDTRKPLTAPERQALNEWCRQVRYVSRYRLDTESKVLERMTTLAKARSLIEEAYGDGWRPREVWRLQTQIAREYKLCQEIRAERYGIPPSIHAIRTAQQKAAERTPQPATQDFSVLVEAYKNFYRQAFAFCDDRKPFNPALQAAADSVRENIERLELLKKVCDETLEDLKKLKFWQKKEKEKELKHYGMFTEKSDEVLANLRSLDVDCGRASGHLGQSDMDMIIRNAESRIQVLERASAQSRENARPSDALPPSMTALASAQGTFERELNKIPLERTEAALEALRGVELDAQGYPECQQKAIYYVVESIKDNIESRKPPQQIEQHKPRGRSR